MLKKNERFSSKNHNFYQKIMIFIKKSLGWAFETGVALGVEDDMANDIPLNDFASLRNIEK